MIDNFALAIAHGLLMLVAWRLIFRGELDDDAAAGGPRPGFLRRAGKDDPGA